MVSLFIKYGITFLISYTVNGIPGRHGVIPLFNQCYTIYF